MTNKEFICTLDTNSFETVMHTLYFNPKLWIEGNDIKKRSTPNMFDVRSWLEKPYDPNSEFWKYILSNDD